MTGLAQAVAQQEVEVAQVASAAVVAEAAADVTVLAAASLVQQATQQAAEQVTEVVEAVEKNEEDLSWLANKVGNLEAAVSQQAETLRLTTEQLQLAISQLSSPVLEASETPPAEPASSVAVVDPQEVVINPNPPPVAEKRRHRLL